MTNSAEISDSIIKQKPQIEEFYEISSDLICELKKLKDAAGAYLWQLDEGSDQTLLGLKVVYIMQHPSIFRHVILIDNGTRIERHMYVKGLTDHG